MGKIGRTLACTGLVALALAPQPSAGFSAEPPPVVVIDPGHGGTKTGARSKGGVVEKSVALDVAWVARDVLRRAGVHVVLTRSDERDLKLADRIELANRLHAHVFVSIHANSSQVATRRGLEMYVLSPESSDDDAASVMHAENEADEASAAVLKVAAVPPQGSSSDLEFILNDLALDTAHQRSGELAQALLLHLAKVPALGPNRGLRQAPFLVLRGAKMPAALVELGYLSHPKQGEDLGRDRVKKEAGEALAKGILGFLQGRHGLRDHEKKEHE